MLRALTDCVHLVITDNLIVSLAGIELPSLEILDISRNEIPSFTVCHASGLAPPDSERRRFRRHRGSKSSSLQRTVLRRLRASDVCGPSKNYS